MSTLLNKKKITIIITRNDQQWQFRTIMWIIQTVTSAEKKTILQWNPNSWLKTTASGFVAKSNRGPSVFGVFQVHVSTVKICWILHWFSLSDLIVEFCMYKYRSALSGSYIRYYFWTVQVKSKNSESLTWNFII